MPPGIRRCGWLRCAPATAQPVLLTTRMSNTETRREVGSDEARSWWDRGAIGLSSLCAVHCLLFPLLALGVPVLSEADLFGGRVHLWLLIAAVPLSFAALLVSQRHHPNRWVAVGIISGLLLLTGGVLAHELLGHGAVEVAVTVLGSAVLLVAHFANLRLHRQRHPAGTPAAHNGP